MARAVADIQRDISALARRDRAQPLRSLISDLDGPQDSGVEARWLAESERRLAQIDSGAAKTYPVKDVLREASSRGWQPRQSR
jgi:hypothetical protein